MGRHENGCPTFCEAPEYGLHHPDSRRIESHHRLIDKNDFRIVGAGGSGMKPILFFASSGSFAMSIPLMMTEPSVGRRTPPINRRVVVFPAPLGPMNPK